jgi:predicted CxxxxCH...CXXCH cytochrome family protein
MSAGAKSMARLAGPGFLTALLVGCSDPQTPSPSGGVEPQVHPDGWVTVNSPEFHGAYIAARNYEFDDCRSCHGNDYSGGLVGVSCRDCHSDAAGPEACNTCHGAFAADASDLRNVAPPAGLDGETLASQPAVGAHQRHLRYNPSRPVIEACQECHRVPTDMRSAGHLDALGPTADVVFADSMASLTTESGVRIPAPVFDPGTHSCSGTYCHGNWGLLKAQSANDFVYVADKIEGNVAAPVWTSPSTAACGTCHGLPPTGHEPHALTECADCHDGVVDAAGGIADSTLHMNGKINVFGEEYPMSH